MQRCRLLRTYLQKNITADVLWIMNELMLERGFMNNMITVSIFAKYYNALINVPAGLFVNCPLCDKSLNIGCQNIGTTMSYRCFRVNIIISDIDVLNTLIEDNNLTILLSDDSDDYGKFYRILNKDDIEIGDYVIPPIDD